MLPRAYRDLGIRYPVQVANRHFDVVFGCFVFGSVSFAFQLVLPGLFRLFFIIGGKKDAVCLALTHVFWITADRDYCFNFVECKSISPNRLGGAILEKAYVRFEFLMFWYSIPLSTKTIDPTAVSANPTKDHSKIPRSRRHEQSIPPIMKNERPQTQRNRLKRVRYRPEHSQLPQIPTWG